MHYLLLLRSALAGGLSLKDLLRSAVQLASFYAPLAGKKFRDAHVSIEAL